MAQVRISTYLKNVGRSFGYAMGDVMTQYNPVVKSIATETKSVATEMYHNIKDFSSGSSIDEKSFVSSAKNTINDAWKNVKDDLRTGNFYNKQRKEEFENSLLKAAGMDFDFDFDFDDDFNFDDESEEAEINSELKMSIQADRQNAVDVMNAVDSVGFKISGAVTTATVESANYIVSSSNKASKALYSLNERGFSSINKGLMLINESIGSISQIANPLNTHLQNSAVFFTKTTQTLNEMNETIQQISKNTLPAKVATNRSINYPKGTFSDIISDGAISIEAYKDMLTDTFKGNKDLLSLIPNALNGLKSGGSYGKNISLMQYATNFVTGLLIPSAFKSAMKDFNESLRSFTSSSLLKIKNTSYGGKVTGGFIIDLLKDTFLPKDGFKKNVSSGDYEKGAIAWDGIARQALVEVIPTTLLKIYSAITGTPEKRYNYKTGKYINAGSIASDFKKEQMRYARNAGGEFLTDAQARVKNDYTGAKQEVINNELENFFYNAFMKGNLDYTQLSNKNKMNDEKKKKFKKDYGISDESWDVLVAVLEQYKNDPKKRMNALKTITAMQQERDAFGNFIRSEEASGNSIYVQLSNDSLELDDNGKIITRGISGSSSGRRGRKSKGEKTTESANNDKKKKEEDKDLLKDAQKEADNLWKDAEDSINDRTKSFKEKISSNPIVQLYLKPFNAMGNMLNKLSDSMYNLIWGSDNDPEKGIFSRIFDSIDEKLGIKSKFGKFMNWMFGEKDESGKRSGGKLKGFWDDTKSNLKNAKDFLVSPVKDFFKKGNAYSFRTAARRGFSGTGSGLISGGDSGIEDPRNREDWNQIKNTSEGRELLKNYLKQSEGKGHKIIREGIGKISGGISEVLSTIFGSGDAKKDNKIIGNVLSKTFKEMGNNKGAMGAGALIGGGVSILTGAVVGPLFGAAIGAGVGLVTKSETIQKILFGDIDENGERTGGLIKKEMSNALTKVAPGIAKGAAYGGIGGLLLGSPVLGAIAGSAIGFVKSSEKAQEKLFGAKDKDGNPIGGLISKELQDKIKKAMPNVATGAILGMIGGPFTTIPNLILGAALGFGTTSQKFHDFMFGDPNKKGSIGLTQMIRDKILGNLDSILHNFSNALIGWGQNLATNIYDRGKRFIQNRKDRASSGKFSLIGLGANAIEKAGRGVLRSTDFIGNRLAGINERRISGNLNKGYNVYGKVEEWDEETQSWKKSKRNLLAAERNALRNSGIGRANSGQSQLDKYLAGIDSTEDLGELKSLLIDAKSSDSEVSSRALEALKNKGINIKKKDINSALRNVTAEAKDKRFSKESQQELKQDKIDSAKIDILTNIDRNISAIATGNPEAASAPVGDSVTSKISNVFSGRDKSIKTIYASSNKAVNMLKNGLGTETSTSSIKTQWTEDGPIQIIKNSQGEEIADIQDSDTAKTLKNQEEKRKGFSSLIKLPSLFGTIGGFLKGFGEKLFGGEKKEGIFSKLYKKLFGDEGMLSGIFGLLSGKFNVAGKILSGVTKESLLSGIALPALLIAGFTGALDNLGEKIGNLAIFKGNDTKSGLGDNRSTTVTTKDGNSYQLKTDANGNYITDANGNYIAIDGTTISKSDVTKYSTAGSDKTISANLKKNLISKTILGQSSIATVVAKGAAKSWNNAVQNVTGKSLGSNIAKIGKKIAEKGGALQIVRNGLTDFFRGKFPAILKKIPFLKSINADDVALTVAESIDDFITKSASSLASKASKVADKFMSALPFIQIAFVASKAINAWGNAESILGITKKATFGQKVIATLVGTINAAIPFIGDLIPNSTLVNIFMKIAPKLGIDVSDLQEQRDEAAAEVEAYNAENGTNYSIEEYNLEVQNYGGLFTKAGRGIKNAYTHIKEKGIGGTLKDIGSNIKEGAGRAVTAIGNGLKTAATKINDVTGFTELMRLASEGDLKGYLTYDNSDGDENESGIGSVVRKIPLLFTKMALLPKALVIMAGAKIVNAVKKVFSDGKELFSAMGASEKEGEAIIKSKDGNWDKWISAENTLSEDNIFNGIGKGAIIGSRLMSFPILLIKKKGYELKNSFMKIVDKVKAGWQGAKQVTTNNINIMKRGDVAALFTSPLARDDDGNPMSPAFGVLSVIERFALAVPTMISEKFHIVYDTVKGVVDKVKANWGNIKQVTTNNIDIMKRGDVAALFTSPLARDNDGNPMSPVLGVLSVAERFVLAVPTMISEKFHIVYDTVKGVVDKIKANWDEIKQVTSSNIDIMKRGDIIGLLSSPLARDDDGNPMSPAFGVLSVIERITLTVPTLISAMGHTIVDPFKRAIDAVKTDWDTFKTNLDSMKQLAEDGKAKEILHMDFEGSDSNPLGGIFNAINAGSKFIFTLKSLFNIFGDSIGDFIKNSVFGKMQNAANYGETSGAGSAASIGIPSGGASGFISQYDPRYQGYSIAGNSFANKGCGPAVASMAAAAMGKNLSVSDAMRYSRGFQNSNGVSMDYFVNALGSRGINTRFISGGGAGDLYNSIAAGNKVVLLGRDPYNTSKAFSPFGPNNHYVLATGLDRSGNVIINDPENNGPRAYSPSILKAAKYGISGGASGTPADWNLGSWSPLTASQINQYIASKRPDSPFNGRGEVFVEAAKQSGLDPRYILAHAATESGWGTSPQALNKNNYFGIGAFDSNPSNAYTFGDGSTTDGLATGIIEGAKWISKNYYNGSYGQTSVNKMRYNNGTHQYCTSNTWVNTISTLMQGMPANTKISFETTPSDSVPTNITVSTSNSSSGSTGANASATGYNSSGSGEEKISIMDVIGKIGSAVSTAFSKLFGFDIGEENSGAANAAALGAAMGASGYPGGAEDYDRLVTNAAKGKGNAKQLKLVEAMKSIAGKISYSMNGPRDPDKGSADCSSTVNWAYKKMLGVDIGNNTDQILRGSNTETIDLANIDKSNGGSNSTGPNVDKLMPGDILLYSRPNAGHSVGRPYRVGHVEMYMGDGQRIGHGSGMGPKITPVTQDSSRYILAKRLKGIAPVEGDKTVRGVHSYNGQMYYYYSDGSISAAGKGLTNQSLNSGMSNNSAMKADPRYAASGSGLLSYDDIANRTGGTSGLLLRNNPSRRLYRGKLAGSTVYSYSGGASALNDVISSLSNNIVSGRNNISSRSVNADELLVVLVDLLKKIADKNSPTDQILALLQKYLPDISKAGFNSNAENMANASQLASVSAGGSGITKNNNGSGYTSEDIDPNIKYLVGQLAAIAKG